MSIDFSGLNPRAVRNGIGSSLPVRSVPVAYAMPTYSDEPEPPPTPSPRTVAALDLRSRIQAKLKAERPPPAPSAPALSNRMAILLGALSLDSPFVVSALVVRCWERWPERFGLKGYPHPDSNTVMAKLSGEGGLVDRGWLARVEPCTYAVTNVGRVAALKAMR